MLKMNFSLHFYALKFCSKKNNTYLCTVQAYKYTYYYIKTKEIWQKKGEILHQYSGR